jgi:uncharacterized DUF497 family protein
VTIEWDPAKARANLAKHGIDFADASIALEDEFALTIEDRSAGGEQRFITLCRDPNSRLIVVVYTYRGDTVRIISARKATSRERQAYEVKI